MFDRPSTTKSPLIFWPFESIFRSCLRVKRNGCGFPRILQVLATKKRMGWANSCRTKHNGYVQKWGMPKIHRNHHNVVFLLHFLKTVCPILRHARIFCTETLPNFLHHWRRRSSSPGRNVFHVCPCYKEQDMHQFHQHVQRHATPCNAIVHCFHSKHFLGSVKICVQHWIFVVCIEKHWVSISSLFSTSLRSRMVEKDVCGQIRAVRRTRNLERNSQKTYIVSAPLLQRGPRVLAESLTSHWDASSCKRLTYTCMLYVSDRFCFTEIKSVHDPVISWHSSTPKYEARMGDLIGNNDGSTNSPCRLQTSSGNSSFTGFHGSLF